MSDRDTIGCTDNGCIFAALRPSGGMGTNGGCKCFEDLISWNEHAQRWNRLEVNEVRRWTMQLAQRLRSAEKDRDTYKAECASISAEFGLPPTMRPREGEIARMLAGWKEARAEVERLTARYEMLGRIAYDDVEVAEAKVKDAYQRGAEAMREAAASCVGSDIALLQTYRSMLEGRIRDLPLPEDK